MTKCKFLVKNSSLNVGCVFAYFVADIKIICAYNFVASLMYDNVSDFKHKTHNNLPKTIKFEISNCYFFGVLTDDRCGHCMCSIKRVVLKNFIKFTGKHLWKIFAKIFLKNTFLPITSRQLLLQWSIYSKHKLKLNM